MRIMIIILALLFIAGCSSTISDIRNEDFVGKEVKVEGNAMAPLQIGDFSGYTLVDKNEDTIAVTTDNLPNEGEEITAEGILVRDAIFGYYIKD